MKLEHGSLRSHPTTFHCSSDVVFWIWIHGITSIGPATTSAIKVCPGERIVDFWWSDQTAFRNRGLRIFGENFICVIQIVCLKRNFWVFGAEISRYIKVRIRVVYSKFIRELISGYVYSLRTNFCRAYNARIVKFHLLIRFTNGSFCHPDIDVSITTLLQLLFLKLFFELNHLYFDPLYL